MRSATNTQTNAARLIEEAAGRISEAAAAKKCWSCGCLHDSLETIERAFPPEGRPAELEAALGRAHARVAERKYDCLGCKVCYPALALNALNEMNPDARSGLEACAAEVPETREGWPPLVGNYVVLRYRAPVGVCTLTDDRLMAHVGRRAEPGVALVGTLQTENLGIERLLVNMLANPHIRFLVVAGRDSKQLVGHLPGQSLVALAQSGVDDRGRIVGAKGKRPVIRNLSGEMVEHFRGTVEVVDMVGNSDTNALADMISACVARDPGPAMPFDVDATIEPVRGRLPKSMVSDPNGYFVLYVDRKRSLLSLEHYQNSGVLDSVIEGAHAAELYTPAIEQGLLSRLDHAAYLGRELARAEHGLRTGARYIQDAAPGRS